jgi:hypothetical protein
MWYGVQETLTDLAGRPKLMHGLIRRLMDGYLHRIDEYERLNLLSLNNGNVRVGSGGLGYTDDLPSGDYAGRARAKDIWGSATAQIFAAVSPAMHEEFALQYEMEWLKRFGLTYYGCCEPLHKKVGILKKIPNLRKISMSSWIDLDEAIEAVGDQFVFSYKPTPSIFAEDSWRPAEIRKDLARFLEKAMGCHIEIIMKDVTTVRYKPERLWEWARIAAAEAERYC